MIEILVWAIVGYLFIGFILKLITLYLKHKLERLNLQIENEKLKKELFDMQMQRNNLALYVKMFDKDKYKPRTIISHTMN